MRCAIVCAAALSALPATAAQTVTAAAVHAAVERFVRTEVSAELAPQERVQVDVRWQRDIELSSGAPATVQLQRLSDRPLRGPTVLRLTVRSGDVVETQMSVTADVRWLRPVLVATRGLDRDEPLSAAMVELDERDVTRVHGGFFSAVEQLAGMRMRRTARPGDMLTGNHTEPIPVVERGARVEVVIASRVLRLSTAGIALQDGGVGERIRVRNADSGKVIYGAVVDASTVRVQL